MATSSTFTNEITVRLVKIYVNSMAQVTRCDSEIQHLTEAGIKIFRPTLETVPNRYSKHSPSKFLGEISHS